MIAPAANSPQFASKRSETHWYIPTATVQFPSDCSTILAMMKSLNVAMNDNNATTAKMGLTRRKIGRASCRERGENAGGAGAGTVRTRRAEHGHGLAGVVDTGISKG